MDKEPIRFVTQEDIPECLELIRDLPETLGLNEEFSCDPIKTQYHLSKWAFERLLYKMVDEDNKIYALLAFGAQDVWWSKRVFLTTRLIFIREDKRTFKNFNRLLQFIINYAKIKGVSILLDVGDASHEKLLQKSNAMKRKGFEPVGMSMYRITVEE